LSDDGEVLVRGPVVFDRYWNNEAETQQAFTSDGWFKTGDLGSLDSDGYLFISGRKKDVIALSGGKKVMPVMIEKMLRQNVLVADAVVVGEGRPYLVALISVQDPTTPERTVADLIASVNMRLATIEQVRQFRLIPNLSSTSSTLTATMKVKRAQVHELYKSLIDAMYPVDFSHESTSKQEGLAVVHSVRNVMRNFALLADDGRDDMTPFFELGLSSFAVAEAARRLSQKFEIDLEPIVVLQHATVRNLAKHIDFLTSGRSAASITSRVDVAAFSEREKLTVTAPACRVANAWNTEQLWELFLSEQDPISVVPPERWLWQSLPDTPRGPVSKWGGFFAGLALFDSSFFRISPREALRMDPQHRMALECAWETLESSRMLKIKDSSDQQIGVFVGVSTGDYAARSLKEIAFDGGTSSLASLAAGRVSYFFGLNGSALSVDTACSSSLVALCLGSLSVLEGQDGASLCLGVQALCAPYLYVSCSGAGMLSPDGRCKTFDASANGFVRSEGCVSVLVRSTTHGDAEVHGGAKLRGFSINQDGRSVGLTAPNGQSQTRLIQKGTERCKRFC
jgi:acyl carrier protein